MILEIKYAENAHYSEECENAMKQIEDVGYAAELKDVGIRKIFMYGIACYQKKCKVMFEEENNCPDIID